MLTLLPAPHGTAVPLWCRAATGAHPPAPPPPLQDFLCGIRGKEFVMVCSDTSAVQSIVTMKQDEDKLVPVDSHKLFAVSGEAGDRVNFSEYIIANARLYALRNGAQLSTKAVANYTRSELAAALRKVGGRGRGRGRGREGGSDRGGVRHRSSVLKAWLRLQAGAWHLCCDSCCSVPASSHRPPAPPPRPPAPLAPQSPYQTNLLMAGYDEGVGPSLYWCDYLATLHRMNICGTGYGEWVGGWAGPQCMVVGGRGGPPVSRGVEVPRTSVDVGNPASCTGYRSRTLLEMPFAGGISRDPPPPASHPTTHTCTAAAAAAAVPHPPPTPAGHRLLLCAVDAGQAVAPRVHRGRGL